MAIEWYPEVASWKDVDFDWENGFKQLQYFDYRVFVALLKAAIERHSVKRTLFSSATGIFYHNNDLNIDKLMREWHITSDVYNRVNSLRYICYHIDQLVTNQVQYKYIDISNIDNISYFTVDKLAQSIGYDSWSNLPRIGTYDLGYPDNPKFLYPMSYNNNKLSEWIISRYKILNKMKYIYWEFSQAEAIKSKEKNASSTLNWEDAQAKFNLKEWTEYSFQNYASVYLNRIVSDSTPPEEYSEISVQNVFEIRMNKPSIDNMNITNYIDIPVSNLDIYVLPFSPYGRTEDFFCPIGRIVSWNKHNLLASIDIDKDDYNQDDKCYISFDTYTDEELASITKPFVSPGESKLYNFVNSIRVVEKFDGPDGFKFLVN